MFQPLKGEEMKKLALFVAMALLAPTLSQAAVRPAAAEGMGGRFGVLAADLGNMPGLGATYWLSDKVALDGALGLMTSSRSVGGSDTAFAFAFAGRYTLAQPVRPLHVQALARVGVANGSQTIQTPGGNVTQNALTIGALVGVGVEVFVLGDNLSLQADTGLSVRSTSSTSSAPGATAINDLALSLGEAGRWLPMNVAVHYYF